MRRIAPVATFTALALGAFATPSFAQDTASDVRCMLVSNLFANSDKDPQAKQIASAASLFYGGRVSLLPNTTVQSGLAAELKQITSANAAPTMNACAKRMTEGLKELQTSSGKLKPEKP